VTIRIHLDIEDPVIRRRIAALLKGDPEVTIEGTADRADLVISGHVATAMAMPTSEVSDHDHSALTPREREVLRLVARGHSNKQIAVDLGLSRHTVKYHLSSILEKLGVQSRTEAVTLGMRMGIVPL
jgi:DNA-binding NarL/FixJ family response regulator